MTPMFEIRTFAIGIVPAALATLLLATNARADDASFYEQHILVSDGSVGADHVDPNLVNAWGVAFNPTGFVWVADNGTGTSTLYDGAGHANALVVTIPAVNGDETGNPTGIVFSGGSDFVVSSGGKSGPARFVFAAENGTLSAWSPTVDATHAIVMADRTGQGAVYKGLAIGGNGSGHLLYATDFHNGRVDVFDGSFQLVTAAGGFRDPQLPMGYAPFGIQNVNGDIVVTFARRQAQGDDEMAGRGLGIADIFDPDGRLVSRVATRGQLNAPWGIALAPPSFGRYGGALLIGNFGDGAINAFDMRTGNFMGTLRGTDGRPLHVEGLWGMAFGNGVLGQNTNTLFFAAGPHDEAGGAYGMITMRHR
jgi:uncharacterized protein (TIGR03118 family)